MEITELMAETIMKIAIASLSVEKAQRQWQKIYYPSQ